MNHLVRAASAAAVLALLAGCGATATTGPLDPHATALAPDASGPTAAFHGAGSIVAGDDWTLPSWARPAANSGFFSEDADRAEKVDLHSLDVTWRQLQPTDGSAIDTRTSGSAEGMDLDGLSAQLKEPGGFWMRIFASGTTWAPTWVAKDCGVTSVGPDYDGQRHLPIWNECVWGHLLDTYRAVFRDGKLAADPRLRFVYVPGAFTWAEYDYDMIGSAVEKKQLTWSQYHRWYAHAWSDLKRIFGRYSDKLVFTGEDYPFGPFGEKEDRLAAQTVEQGYGIRTGITEVSNFHLSEAPSYGSHVEENGHMSLDASGRGDRIFATENECYTDCGYTTKDPYYAVRQSNLKALQLRMNWIYVVPGPSYFAEYPEHWDWVRLSMGQTASSSADAWAQFRDAEDTYWKDNDAAPFGSASAWPSKPWVRNLERWLVQVDEPGSVAHRTRADVHRNVFEKDNGTALEGLSTDVAAGDTGFVLAANPAFARAAGSAPLVAKISYLDRGAGSFAMTTPAGASAPVTRTGDGAWKTATVALPDGALGGDHRIRVALAAGSSDLVVRMVRVVRTQR